MRRTFTHVTFLVFLFLNLSSTLAQGANPDFVLGLNGGGPELEQNGNTYFADQYFIGGAMYTNPNALVSAMYKTERSSPSRSFQYNVPISNGAYSVVLYFAEIYWGATGGGPGGSGRRVFDVHIEGNLVLDNYDIYDEVGAEVVQKKSFDVNITDGLLTIDFSALASAGGVDQPKISAIEINQTTINEPPVALIEADSVLGQAPLNVQFDGGNSSDDKGVTSYLWNFGDGTTSTEQDPQHIFTTQGTYLVSLTVEDEEGLSNTDSIIVTANGENSEVLILGELKKWHTISLLFTGPETSEDDLVNPFLDYRLNVTFTSPTGGQYVIPGFYAADGNAAETSATSGNKWQVRFSPDEIGEWSYSASFRTGDEVAVSLVESAGTPIAFDGANGNLSIGASDKSLPDNRSKGRLEYVGERYLKFSETEEYFLKAGADSPENLLAYSDFDNTLASKDWAPHVQDWSSVDPIWKTNKGKGVIGAINYLSGEGMNAFSFLTMNVIGDGKDVWPWSATNHSELDGNSQGEIDHRLRYDVSKLEQWEKVFDHSDKKGMFLHFKTQETENDQLLDQGQLGTQRKLYYRELIARFGHHMALNWNLGEEYDIYNGLSDPQNLILKEYISYISILDAYDHPIVVHSYPFAQTNVYNSLLGPSYEFTGPSMQSHIDDVHRDVVKWVQDSKNAGKQWVVSNDEQGGPETGVTSDSDYTGNQGTAADNRKEVRYKSLWGTLMGGGAGVEYYFGYSTGETDLSAQDYRSRASKWRDAQVALDFFQQHVSYWKMDSHDDLISNSSGFCLAEPGESYLIYLPSHEATTIDLTTVNGAFSVEWFDPQNGGDLQQGGIQNVTGGELVDLGNPPSNANSDWVILLKKSTTPLESIFINTGGSSLIHEGDAFGADQYAIGGQAYANSNALVPEMYQTERSSPTKTFQYNVPISNGVYTVELHFAEIYWGATGGGPGAIGRRIFDVNIEEDLVLDNYDIYADVGAEVIAIKTFEVTVNDGFLNFEFDALGSDGVDQPKVSAIKILGSTDYPAIVVEAIPNQSNSIGEEISILAVNANGGDPSGNFSYDITGQPNGITIEPETGIISGTIENSAATGGVNGNGEHQVVITVEKQGSLATTINFEWLVTDTFTFDWRDKEENEAYEAKGECGFVQVGNKFYIIGGLENQNTFVYDYTVDSWTDLGEAPFLFNHFQPVAYKGLIWVIGALKNRQWPNDSPSEFVWIFDPVGNTWTQGPAIPQERVRGSAGLVVHNDKFYVVGGTTNGHNGGYVPWLDEFDPQTGNWRVLPDAPRPRDHFYAVQANNKIYAVGGRWTGGIGGFFGPDLPEVDVFDFETEVWSTLPVELNLPTPRAGAPVAFFQNKIMVMGGEIENAFVYGEEQTEVALKITEGFDLTANSWSRLSDTAFPRHGTNAIVSGEGIFMTSGSAEWGAGSVQQNMEFYGIDAPVGAQLIKSDFVVQPSLLFSDTQPTELSVQVANGNTALFVKSIEIIGDSAGDVEILSGNLENQLLLPNTQYTITLQADNPETLTNTILKVNSDARSVFEVALVGSILINPGDQTSTVGDQVSLQTASSASANYVFSASNLPEGLSIDGASGLISGSITGSVASSPYNTEVTLLNASTLATIATEQFEWNVIDIIANGVVSFTLVNADNESDIFNLLNNDQIGIQNSSLTIRANTNPNIVGSVLMQLVGPVSRTSTENFAPYALFGDNSGNYFGQELPIGNYTISATAYSGSNRSGSILNKLTIQFSIQSSFKRDLSQMGTDTDLILPEKSNQKLELIPNPAGNSTTLSFEKPTDILSIQIFDVMGRLVQTFSDLNFTNNDSYLLDTHTIPAGTYFIKSYDSKGNSYQKQMFIKK